MIRARTDTGFILGCDHMCIYVYFIFIMYASCAYSGKSCLFIGTLSVSAGVHVFVCICLCHCTCTCGSVCVCVCVLGERKGGDGSQVLWPSRAAGERCLPVRNTRALDSFMEMEQNCCLPAFSTQPPLPKITLSE